MDVDLARQTPRPANHSREGQTGKTFTSVGTDTVCLVRPNWPRKWLVRAYGDIGWAELGRLHGSFCRASGVVHLEPSGEPRYRELVRKIPCSGLPMSQLCQSETGGLFVFALFPFLVSKTGLARGRLADTFARNLHQQPQSIVD